MTDDLSLSHIPKSVLTGNGTKVTTGDLLAVLDLVLGEIRSNREERKKELAAQSEELDKEIQDVNTRIDFALEDGAKRVRAITDRIEQTLADHVKQNIICFENINTRLDTIDDDFKTMERASELSEATKADRKKVERFVKNEWKWIIIVLVFALSSVFLWIGQIYDILHGGG